MQLSIYFFEPPFLPLLHLIWLINSLPPPPPNGCNHTCLEPRPQKVSVEDQGLGSTNYINSYYCVSPRPSATLLQVTYPTHLFLPLSHHPHFVLMFTSLPTSPQEHSFLTCFFGVWYKLLLPDHVPQVFLCTSPAALENHGKGLPYSPLSVCSSHIWTLHFFMQGYSWGTIREAMFT